jgi:hypothetical protein
MLIAKYIYNSLCVYAVFRIYNICNSSWMGCTPTSRKRTIVPAGQANPVGLSVNQIGEQKGKAELK